MTDANLASVQLTDTPLYDHARAAYRRWQADQERERATAEAQRRDRLGRIRAAVNRAVANRLSDTIAAVLLRDLTDDEVEFTTSKNGRWVILRAPGAAPVRVNIYARIHGDDIAVTADETYVADAWKIDVTDDDEYYVYVTQWREITDPYVLLGAALEHGPEYERDLAEVNRHNDEPPASQPASAPARPASAEWLEQAEIELEEGDSTNAAACALLAVGHLLTVAVSLLDQAERRAAFRDYMG